MRLTAFRIAGLALTALLASCETAEQPPAAKLVPVQFGDLAGWQDDNLSGFLPAFSRSCALHLKRPDDRPVTPSEFGVTAGDWKAACAALAAVPAGDPAALRQAIETHFGIWRLEDVSRGAEGVATGYYEPRLRGARQPAGPYRTPLYRRPPELVTVDLGEFSDDLKGKRITGQVEQGRLKPMPPRKEIVAGAYRDRGLELVWVDDPVDAFFLQIQGSGQVVLPDGDILRVGYDGANGRSYTPVGRILIRDGEVPKDKMSMQAIRGWMEQNPDRAGALMDENASFVFFRELKGDGPIGAEGVALTPGRSIAVDRRFLPLGMPVWISTADPETGAPIRRLVMAQDTGGAIRGVVRLDLFWGPGEEAAHKAGLMNQPVNMFLLLPRGFTPPSA
ncbi:MAG: MltA domain-containing protein [Rhodospirillales bacterium]